MDLYCHFDFAAFPPCPCLNSYSCPWDYNGYDSYAAAADSYDDADADS